MHLVATLMMALQKPEANCTGQGVKKKLRSSGVTG